MFITPQQRITIVNYRKLMEEAKAKATYHMEVYKALTLVSDALINQAKQELGIDQEANVTLDTETGEMCLTQLTTT